MPNLLILGGTGFVGPPIVAEFLRLRYSITILSRGRATTAFAEPVEFLQADRTSTDSLKKAVTGRTFDAVIDNLAFTREDVLRAGEVFAGKIGQYVLTSSVVVYGQPSARMVSEDEVCLSEVPEGEIPPAFGKSTTLGKRQCELVLREKLARNSLPFEFTVLRPAKIHGRGDPSPRLWWYIQRLHDGGPLVLPAGSPDPLIRHVYCDDLATAYVGVLLNRACRNQTYNIAGHEVIPLSVLIESIAKTLGKALKIIKVPSKAMQSEGLLEFSHPLLRTGDVIPDISKAQRDFGWSSRPLPEWIGALCNWYLNAPVEDSWGYALRQRELEVASRFA